MKNIWIVGASSGIGKDLAIAYGNLGHRVFVSARSLPALEALAASHEGKGEIIPMALDITQESAIQSVTARIAQQVGHLNTVIVNAGTCEYVDDVQVDTQLVKRVLDTNYMGAIAVSNHVLPLLQKGVEPQLVFVSSSVTYQALPRAHAYGASKAALRYFAECLKMDVQKQGIDVRLVSPGFVKTPLTDKNDFDMPFMISSEDAAQRIINGLKGKQFDIHFPKRFTWTLKLFSCLPDSIKFNLLGKMSRYEQRQFE